MSTHLAAMSQAQGQPFELQTRTTPKPGPNELLIAIKSIALNPADVIMRNKGLFISTYPTVLGFDMAGLVLETGAKVPKTFQPNITRVAAYASSVWKGCNENYGPFQEKCLVPWQHASPLPDGDISWNEAATFPVAVQVPLSAWDAMNIPRLGEPLSTLGNSIEKKEALLIWGASSSVGSMGVQTARLLREDPGSAFAAVYATSGAGNMEYISSLGADRVFNYKDLGVIDEIVSAAREDGVVIRYCFLATGDLGICQDVLKRFLGQKLNGEEIKMAKIASAPLIPQDAKVEECVDTIFVMPSADEVKRLEQFQYWIGTWLKGNLVMQTIRPSPKPTVVGRGLGAINAGLNRLERGVSCTKLVVEIAE
ncbi:GroES-like protein [Penicillium hetheringtonii]|uniref:GroES-like protein n=1 Tax=Penicillium hetheringtonii TaxID=911720 RepID=A0AAD6GQ41_9EURO|nr:GroES-like protein [Penicillium hetheringtonii]